MVGLSFDGCITWVWWEFFYSLPAMWNSTNIDISLCVFFLLRSPRL